MVGNHVGDIGAAVMARVEGTGYGIIRDLVGHGLGREVHEEPQVPNVGKAGHGPASPGGHGPGHRADAWGGNGPDPDPGGPMDGDHGRPSPSAHFEHTIAVTRDGPQVLTGPVPAGYKVLPSPALNPGVG